MKIRTYSELVTLKTFRDRYEYLRLGGMVGEQTFGFDRYINQMLYKSNKWRSLRNAIIIRDNCCDLGIQDRDIMDQVTIHHMNPITIDDIINETDKVFNPEYLISTSSNTHNAIHYGNASLLVELPKARRPGDTKLW